MFSRVHISQISFLEKFHSQLHSADQRWDSIRRIPYSTPGRWVHILDLSKLAFTCQSQALLLDSLLTRLFPLLPFLARFSISPSFVLSHHAMASLAGREEVSHIRSLEGIAYVPSHRSVITGEEPLVQLLRCCHNLEELEVIGPGLDPSEFEFPFDTADVLLPESFTPLNLSNLHTLTLLSMHSSPLMATLQLSLLPSLRKLTMTPYDDIPYPASLVSHFIATHGATLRSLLLYTPKSWPTKLSPSPYTLLHTSPNLRHLSLENPLPSLTVAPTHPLQILSIPRPNPEFWRILERLLPQLPSLRAVRARDVRWLRKGMTLRAQEAGVQGEMREWRRRLFRRGIRVLDTDWKENE